MLLTRCPECRTTFRINGDVLAKAGGQVRCGRCNNVFNAFAELRDAPTESPLTADTGSATPAASWAEDKLSRTDEFPVPSESALEAAASFEPQARGEGHRGAVSHKPALERHPQDQAHAEDPSTSAAGEGPDTAPAGDSEDDALAVEGISWQEVIAQIELTSRAEDEAPEDALHGDAAPPAEPAPDTISPEQIDAVLLPHAPETGEAVPAWAGASAVHESGDRTRLWQVAAAVAAAALLLQVVHHFRTDLAERPIVGPALQAAYAEIGVDLDRRWDIGQYQIHDWVAAAEPNLRGQGSLRITARIQNRGPRAQPYPHIQLELTDRWEKVVGRRVFAPQQYLASTVPPAALMARGETVQAVLDVVDPGPDAYGFELDVCVEVAAKTLRCATDTVFR